MIETKRLKIYPASEGQMRALIAEQSTDDLKAAYTEMLDGCLSHPERWVWYTDWMIDAKDGTHVGNFCFKGVDETGSTEIGYGIEAAYRGHGYATEAVTAAVAWALSQDGVRCVNAETDPENVASQKVLEKAGFVPTGVIGEEGPLYRRTGNGEKNEKI